MPADQPTDLDIAELDAWNPDPHCEICGDARVLPHPDGDDEPCAWCPPKGRRCDG